MSRAYVLLVAGVLGACTASDGSDGGMLVSKHVAPGDDCTFTSTETEPIIASGAVQIGYPYLAFPQIKSRITATDDQVDQRTIITTEADIDLEFLDTELFDSSELADLKSQGVTHFKELFTVPVQPNGGITDANFTLVPADVSEAIIAKHGTEPASFQTTILATYTIKGNMSGETIDSNAFQFPVTIVGSGILIPAYTTGCPAPSGVTPRTGNSCNPAQDGVVDCCGTAGSANFTCPAPMGSG